jgi:transposase
VDVEVLDDTGTVVLGGPRGRDAEALNALVEEVGRGEVRAVIESMTGARHVHDVLETHGWDVLIADAVKVKGLAPLACKTDRIDAHVLAELSRRDLVPEIWLPDPQVRGARERARFRLHLVKHRSMLKNRVHSTLHNHGIVSPVSDLFGVGGRQFLADLEVPEPWAGTVAASTRLIDDLETQIDACEAELRRLGATHPYIPLLQTVPGIAWTLGYTIAAEIGDITRFETPTKLIGYTGLCPRVYQSGDTDRRGPLTKHGPKYLRWALIEAATHACRHRLYADRYARLKARHGRQRGAKVAQTDLARRLTFAIWHMCTRNQEFAPAGAPCVLTA